MRSRMPVVRSQSPPDRPARSGTLQSGDRDLASRSRLQIPQVVEKLSH
jgi:hypothetical protein